MAKLSEKNKVSSFTGKETIVIVDEYENIILFDNIQSFIGLIKDSIRVGIRNLLLGSNLKVNRSPGVTLQFFSLRLSQPLVKGETYIITAYIEGEYEEPVLSNGALTDVDRQSVHFGVPFIAKFDTQTHVRCFHLGSMNEGTVGYPMLVKGNIPVGWIPAPEDMING